MRARRIRQILDCASPVALWRCSRERDSGTPLGLTYYRGESGKKFRKESIVRSRKAVPQPGESLLRISFSSVTWFEVGTWDPEKFTRADGVWEVKYTADERQEFKFTGSGIGGSIDGLHAIATATRASSFPKDPYLMSGMITALGHD
jgi:hypothetical protein